MSDVSLWDQDIGGELPCIQGTIERFSGDRDVLL
jgi:hypothetical protein